MVCCWYVFRYMFMCVNVYSIVHMAYYCKSCMRLKLESKPSMLKLIGDTTTNSLMARELVYGTRDDGSIPL